MNEQIKKYIDPIKNFWVNLSKKKKIIILSSLGGVIILSVILGLVLNTQKYVVLYPGLDSTEAVSVMNELKDRKVSYKEDGGTIYVPEDKENSLRMELANLGYPSSAPNYDFFTKNIDIMSTDFEKKTIEKYQLNQRLEAVIKTLDCIKNANVTISIPESSGYAWDDKNVVPTASITVQLATGKTLDTSQVNGIKQLVAKSVPSLTVDNVVVIDTATGKELNSSTLGSAVDISTFKMQVESEYEKDVEKNVLKVLEPVFGNNNVQVTAKSIVDVSKKVSEIMTYKPATDDNKGVISESTINTEQQKGSGTTGGTVGTDTNADTSTYTGVTTDGNTVYVKNDQDFKYLVSYVKDQIQDDSAGIKDMTISVAINQEAMDAAQKEQITKLIAYAAAIQPDKVAVYNSVFPKATTNANTTPAATDINQAVLFAGAAGLNLLFVLLVVFIVISRQRKKKMKELLEANEQAALMQESEEAVSVPTGPVETEEEMRQRIKEEFEEKERIQLDAIREAKQTKEQKLKKELQDFSSQNPEIAAQLVKTWLRGEDIDG